MHDILLNPDLVYVYKLCLCTAYNVNNVYNGLLNVWTLQLKLWDISKDELENFKHWWEVGWFSHHISRHFPKRFRRFQQDMLEIILFEIKLNESCYLKKIFRELHKSLMWNVKTITDFLKSQDNEVIINQNRKWKYKQQRTLYIRKLF